MVGRESLVLSSLRSATTHYRILGKVRISNHFARATRPLRDLLDSSHLLPNPSDDARYKEAKPTSLLQSRNHTSSTLTLKAAGLRVGRPQLKCDPISAKEGSDIGIDTKDPIQSEEERNNPLHERIFSRRVRRGLTHHQGWLMEEVLE